MLTTLLSSKHQSIKDLEISALVRDKEKANILKERTKILKEYEKILKEAGVNPIQFRDLDDSAALIKAASQHDSKF